MYVSSNGSLFSQMKVNYTVLGMGYPCKIFTKNWLARFHRDWRHLAEMRRFSPCCLLDSKSRQNHREISSILPRLLRACWDFPELAEIAEISPRLKRSCHDVCEILNLGEIAVRSPPSHQDYRDLAMMFVSFWILARLQQDFAKMSAKSKTKKDILKRRIPFFFNLESLSKKQQLFFISFALLSICSVQWIEGTSCKKA